MSSENFESQSQEHHNHKSLHNETPAAVKDTINYVFLLLESYGWFILIGVVVCGILYKKLKPNYDKWKQEQQDWYDAQQSKKNPDKAYKIQMSMEKAREKLQKQVVQDAEKKKEARMRKDEEERKQKIEEWEKHQSGRGYHSKSKPKPKDNPQEENTGNTFKPKRSTFRRSDFNPLSGSGGSGGYRPSPRRNMGGG